MIQVTNLRKGTIFIHEGRPWKTLNYEHIKVARGGAFIKVKAVDLLGGTIKEITFNNGDRVDEADIENKNLQYLYHDAEFIYFMDETDYQQLTLPVKVAEYELRYLVEGQSFMVTVFEGNPIAVSIPPSMFYKVIEAPPAVKGNTATAATKNIKLENGLVITAPQFITEGDIVKVNTETGEYVSRGK